MDGLPRDVWVNRILSQLSWRERCRVARTCRRLREAVLMPVLWHVLQVEAELLPLFADSVYAVFVRKAVVGPTPLACLEKVTAVGEELFLASRFDKTKVGLPNLVELDDSKFCFVWLELCGFCEYSECKCLKTVEKRARSLMRNWVVGATTRREANAIAKQAFACQDAARADLLARRACGLLWDVFWVVRGGVDRKFDRWHSRQMMKKRKAFCDFPEPLAGRVRDGVKNDIDALEKLFVKAQAGRKPFHFRWNWATVHAFGPLVCLDLAGLGVPFVVLAERESGKILDEIRFRTECKNFAVRYPRICYFEREGLLRCIEVDKKGSWANKWEIMRPSAEFSVSERTRFFVELCLLEDCLALVEGGFVWILDYESGSVIASYQHTHSFRLRSLCGDFVRGADGVFGFCDPRRSRYGEVLAPNLADAVNNGAVLSPDCSFVAHWIGKHPIAENQIICLCISRVELAGNVRCMGEQLISFECGEDDIYNSKFVDPLHLVLCGDEEFTGVELDTLRVHRQKVSLNPECAIWRKDKRCFELFLSPLAGRWSSILVGEGYPEPVPFPAWEDEVSPVSLELLGENYVLASNFFDQPHRTAFSVVSEFSFPTAVHPVKLLAVEPVERSFWLGVTSGEECFYEVARGVGENRKVVWRRKSQHLFPLQPQCGALRLSSDGRLQCFLVEPRDKETLELKLYNDILGSSCVEGQVLVVASNDALQSFAVHPTKTLVLYWRGDLKGARILNFETRECVKIGRKINVDYNWQTIGWSKDGRYCFGTQAGSKPFYLESTKWVHLKRFSPCLGVTEERGSEQIRAVRQVGARLLVSLEGPSRAPWGVPVQRSQLRFYLEGKDEEWSVLCVLDVGDGASSFIVTQDVLLVTYYDGSFLKMATPVDLERGEVK